jgi:hypothetical protein
MLKYIKSSLFGYKLTILFKIIRQVKRKSITYCRKPPGTVSVLVCHFDSSRIMWLASHLSYWQSVLGCDAIEFGTKISCDAIEFGTKISRFRSNLLIYIEGKDQNTWHLILDEHIKYVLPEKMLPQSF